MQTLRYGDPDSARRYPLPVSGTADWQPRDGGWQLRLTLPDVPPGTLLVPSLACAPPDSGHHQWTLQTATGCWSLNPVPALPEPPAPAPPARGNPVSTHVDCYRVHRPLSGPLLHLWLDAPRPPPRYLVCVSSRPFTVADPPCPERRAGLPQAPPARSQMTAPAAIAERICSPTCVSMVLELWQRSHDWLTLVGQCHDPLTGMYGVWPLALQAAAQHGCVGAVEVFADWRGPLAVLERGVPLVTSLRFGGGELPGAPLTETGGHLVVLHAAGPATVSVCDPAAAPDAVRHDYQADAFSRAWLRHRGAAYILPP